MIGTRSIVFYKFDETWVLPTHGKTPAGYSLHIDPVLLVEATDVQGLRMAIIEQLENQPAVPEPGPVHHRLPVFVKAVHLRSLRAFHVGARAFQITKSAEELSLEEWKNVSGSAFAGPPIWKRRFGPEAFDELVWFLVKHENVGFSVPSEGEGGKNSH